MKVMMKAYHANLTPGQIGEFEDDEAERQVSVGGARHLTSAELAAAEKAEALAADKAKLSAMTVDELKTFAADHKVDLGDATKKADIIAAIELHAEAAANEAAATAT